MTKPSAEHLPIYAGILIALTVISGIVFLTLGKKDEGLKVTLDEVADPAKKRSSKSPSKKECEKEGRTRVKKRYGTLIRDALFEELDKNGPFVRTLEGTVEPEDTVKLKQIITKHAYITF